MHIVKQVRATLGDAPIGRTLSLWADFVTHANACYMDAIIRTGPSVALYPEPLDLT
jgi:hypothetical protein